jgi:hypothetical protein
VSCRIRGFFAIPTERLLAVICAAGRKVMRNSISGFLTGPPGISKRRVRTITQAF